MEEVEEGRGIGEEGWREWRRDRGMGRRDRGGGMEGGMEGVDER